MSATITAPVMAGKGVSIFDGTDFTTWKLKLLWYLGSIHDEMERVLTEGPIIPGKWTEAMSNADGTVIKPVEFIQTPRTQWTDQDAILYRFDRKIRSIIGNAISVPILRKVGHAKTAKAMSDILLNDFEGVTVDTTQKKKNFVRLYENFTAKPKESLFDLHSRFQVLINDLEGAGVIKTQAELCQKFVDALPETFKSIITSMVVSEKLDNYDHSGLFGILTHFEETKLKKKINAKEIAKDPDAALVATTKRNKNYSQERKATCFKCEKIGHIAAECWSKVDSSSDSGKYLEKAKKYKQKYKNLKKEGVKSVVKKAEKALYTKTWDDEDSSSDKEEDKCLMAVIEQEKSSSQFEADLKIAEKLNSQSNSDKSTAYKIDGDKQFLTNAFVRPEFGSIYSTKLVSESVNTDSRSKSESSYSDTDSIKQSDTVISGKMHVSKGEKQKCFEIKAVTKLKKRISKLCKKLKDKTKVNTELNKPKSLEKVNKWLKLDKRWSNIHDQFTEKFVWIENKPFVWRNERKWFLNSGCSRHMTGCKEHLEGFVEGKGPSVRYGDNSVGKTIGYGFVKAGGVSLKRVALVKGFISNLTHTQQIMH
ncbi:uncharacterized protein [Rutidosis leptorrhynchoides]|uniref:uncharacterized protein n=1 Tax=Rutidosis leptorrhynchoides TaxID=125765 RepID=UPI003A98F510